MCRAKSVQAKPRTYIVQGLFSEGITGHPSRSHTVLVVDEEKKDPMTDSKKVSGELVKTEAVSV